MAGTRLAGLVARERTFPQAFARKSKTVRERDLARTDVVAAAAVDAVEQAVRGEAGLVVRERSAMQLLRQQSRRTHRRAVAATDAGHLVRADPRFEVASGRDQHAIDGLAQADLV